MFDLIKKYVKSVKFLIEIISRKQFVEFHHFPFNTLLPLPLSAKDELCNVVRYLSGDNVKFRVTDGTALGLYRDNRFIPHDNDLDFDLLDLKNQIRFIIILKKKFGYNIGRVIFYKMKLQQVVFYNKEGLIVDFVVWYKSGDRIYNYSERGFVRSQYLRSFDNLDLFVFNNVALPIPGDIENWLCFRYGNDWMIPKTYKGDWKLECGDINKI
jgi:hypothetical protein